VRYQQSPSIKLYIIVLIIFALGLLAKPMLVTLPFVLVLLDYWQFQRKITQGKPLSDEWGGELRFFKKSFYNKIPLIILSILSSIITYIVQQQGGATKAASVSFPDRVANAIISYGQYFRKTVLPTDLSIFYPHPSNNIPSYQIGIVVTVLILFTVITLKLRSRQPSLIVGWFWYLGTLVPVIGFIQVGLQGMADRYMYIPMVGLSIMIAWSVPTFFRTRQMQKYRNAKSSRILERQPKCIRACTIGDSRKLCGSQ
ncbi:MAG: hypothetical protein HY800_01285, partial [Ignavibacteriales bacterium]|nr:hypothetical protein [Ignavibacteriales bacterium]